MSASTRKITATTIFCLLFALIIKFNQRQELVKIQTMSAESYVADKQESLQMAFPGAAFSMLVFVALYEGLTRVVAYALSRFFPDADSEPTADRAIKPVRVSEADWSSGGRNARRVTTVDDDSSQPGAR